MDRAFSDKFRAFYNLGDDDTFLAGQRLDSQGRNALTLNDEQLARDRAAGIGKDAFKRATEFEQTWRRVWATIGTMAQGGESKLTTALTGPMKEFGNWLDTHKDQINDAIDKMAKAVVSLTTAWVEDLSKVNWPDVATHIDEAAKSIAHFADALARSLPLLQAFLGALLGAKLGGLFGPLGALVGAGVGAIAPGVGEHWNDNDVPDTGVGGLLGRAWGGVKRLFGGGGAPAGLRARGAGGAPTGNEAELAKQAYAYWRGQGLSHDAALAVIGNQRGENALGSLNRGDGGSAGGQFQWHADRRADILAHTGIDVLTAGFMDQQKAARWEMENGAGGGHVWNAMKNAKSREDAIWTMVHGFERSGDQRGDAAIRLGYADRYGKIISDSAASPAPTPTTSSGPRPAGSGHFNTRPGPSPQELSWDQGQIWNGLNAALPVGPSTTNNSSKNVSSTVTNNITVSGSDPQSTAAMVGLHLNRTANDIGRTLQGAQQ